MNEVARVSQKKSEVKNRVTKGREVRIILLSIIEYVIDELTDFLKLLS